MAISSILIGKYLVYRMLVQFFKKKLSIKLDYTLCPFGIKINLRFWVSLLSKKPLKLEVPRAFVTPARIERATDCLEGSCSIP
jgi:hypothetical protein